MNKTKNDQKRDRDREKKREKEEVENILVRKKTAKFTKKREANGY